MHPATSPREPHAAAAAARPVVPAARSQPRGVRRRGAGVALLAASLWAATPAASRSQEADRYILGEEKRLEMIVHVFGEVVRPGEYRVPDDTDVLELLSKAGGPTEFARLSGVSVTRANPAAPVAAAGTNGETPPPGPRVLHVDLKNYLEENRGTVLPALQPGDVVVVPRNKFSKWKSVAGILRDVSVVASAYFLYLRATRN